MLMLQSGTKFEMPVCKQTTKLISLLSVIPVKHQYIKKFLGLRLSEICDMKNSKTETHWECQTLA